MAAQAPAENKNRKLPAADTEIINRTSRHTAASATKANLMVEKSMSQVVCFVLTVILFVCALIAN